MIRVSQLQEYDPTEWGVGVTKKEHLGSAGLLEPQTAIDTVQMLYNANYRMSIGSYLKQFPIKKFKDDTDFRWMLATGNLKNLSLVGARPIGGSFVTSTSTDRLGLGHTRFELVFSEKRFSEQDIIVGEKNSLYPIRIAEAIYSEGTNFVCVCEFMTGDQDASIPVAELLPGKKFSRDFNPVAKAFSTKGAEPFFNSPFSMKNQFTQIRAMLSVPGNMAYQKENKKVAFSWTALDENGKKVTHTTWVEHIMWQFEKQFQEQKEYMINYAYTNRKPDGTYAQKEFSGEIVQIGSGLEEQVYSGTKEYYSDWQLDINWITNMIMDISDNSRKFGDRRQVIMRTGKWGALAWSNAIKDYAQLYTPLTDSQRVQRASQWGFSYTDGFREYVMADNTILSVMVDPLFDDEYRNKVKHPSGYGVAKSWEYQFMNAGMSEDVPNIQLAEIEGEGEIMRFIPGMRCSFQTPSAMAAIATSEDAYSLHRMWTGGVMVVDPSRFVSLLPNIY